MDGKPMSLRIISVIAGTVASKVFSMRAGWVQRATVDAPRPYGRPWRWDCPKRCLLRTSAAL
jgi:hypothetical protein